MRLLPSQKTRVWQVMVARGLDPNDYEWWESDDDTTFLAPIVDNSERPWFFSVAENSMSITTDFIPGLNSLKTRLVVETWDEVLGLIDLWCEAVQHEADFHDPWKVRQDFSQLITEEEASEDDHRLFSVEEQAQMVGVLRSWEEQVLHALDQQTGEVGELKLYVSRQFELLREALPTKPRGDWRQMARDFLVSAAASIAVQCGPSAAAVVVEVAHVGLKALAA